MQHLIPADDDFVMLANNLLQPLVEVGLQVLLILHAVLVHERLDLSKTEP